MKHTNDKNTAKLTRRGLAFLLAMVLTTSAFVPGLTARATEDPAAPPAAVEDEILTLESLEPPTDYTTAVKLMTDLDTLAQELTAESTAEEVKAVYDAVVTAQADAEALTDGAALSDEQKAEVAAQAAAILAYLEDERGYEPEEEASEDQSDEPVCTCGTDTQIHATDCDLYVAPCGTCGETGTHKADCATLCTCEDKTQPHVEGCKLYVAPACGTCGEIGTHKADCATLCTCADKTQPHVEGCPLYVAPACGTCGETGTHKADCATLCTCEDKTQPHVSGCPLYICADCGLNQCICGLESAYLLDGAVIYQDMNDPDASKTISGWNTSIKVKASHTAEDGTVWYEFTYTNLLKELLNGYHFVKAADTTTLKCTCTPVEGEHAEECPLYEAPTYVELMKELAALEEESKTLANGLDRKDDDYIDNLTAACDDFCERLYALINEIADLWDVDAITDDEYYAAEEKAIALLEYLNEAYGYENGFIQPLATAAARLDDKQTDNADGAIKFQLFNYSERMNHATSVVTDTTLRPIATYFTFRDSNNHPEFPNDKKYDYDGFGKDHATVDRILYNGYPALNLRRYADGETRADAISEEVAGLNLRSLDYLFKSGDHAVTAYAPTNSILQKQGDRYFYDSANNAVDYDVAHNVFRVRNYLERTQTTSGYKGYSDFMPFVYTDGQSIGSTTVGTETIPYHIDNFYRNTETTTVKVPVDYWYGMVMEVDFYMPKDGKVNGQDMVFSFSGDDDVWVFIDDVLVLDLGGTHGTVNGNINFATGKIQQYLSWGNANSKLKDDGTDPKVTGSDTSFPTTLKACYTAAGVEPNADAYGDSWNAEGDAGVTFADYSKHKLKFFYMERGGGVANCMLDFNLATIPDGGVKVKKDLTGADVTHITADDDYTFELRVLDDGNWVIPEPAEYFIEGVTVSETDENGRFTIRQGQTAQFTKLPSDKRYRVQEVGLADAEFVNISYQGIQQTNPEVDETTRSVAFLVIPGDTQNTIQATFTNELKTTDFTVKKMVTGNMGDLSKEFNFTAKLYYSNAADAAQLPFQGNAYRIDANGVATAATYTTNAAGAAEFKLKHGESFKFDNIPNGAYVVIEEDNQNYVTKVSVDGSTEVTGKEVSLTTDLDANNDVATFTNHKDVPIDTGVALDSIPYILILGVVAVAGFLFLRKRRVED